MKKILHNIQKPSLINSFLMKFIMTLISPTILFLFLNTDLQAQPKPKPNLVLIMADDLGYECLGINGGESYQTPVLDKLASTGMRFLNCYSQPLCTPSRVELMTGVYNMRNYIKFGKLERSQTTFAHLLKKVGYKTCIVGKWQLGKEVDSPLHFGFDEYCLWQHTHGRTDELKHDTRYVNPLLDINGKTIRYTNGEYGPDISSDYLCDFIERNKDHLFLAYYSMILTHCPFTPTPDSKDWNPKDMGSLSYKGDPEYFGDMVRYMDKLIGKIIGKLEELDLRKNTLILFMGDNGTDQPVVSILNGNNIPGGKGLTSTNGTHVPLIANWPGVIPDGKTCNDLIDFTDFLPTLCQVAGRSVPGDLNIDGRSFLQQLYGKKGHPRKWIYSWYCPYGKDVKEWAQDQEYKLYSTGEFYNINQDPFEKKQLDKSSLRGKMKKAYHKLEKVLSQY